MEKDDLGDIWLAVVAGSLIGFMVGFLLGVLFVPRCCTHDAYH